MRFLVEIDHPKTGQPLSADSARAFVANVITPTLTKAEQLVAEGRIVAGGPVAGRIALRFIADVESVEQLDHMVSSIPLWAISDSRVTPLIAFSNRRAHIEALLKGLPE